MSTYRKIRSIRLQPTQDATIFSCKMPPSFDTKPNTVIVTSAKVSYRCPAVHTSWADPSVVIRSFLLSVVCCLHFLWNRQNSSLQGPLGTRGYLYWHGRIWSTVSITTWTRLKLSVFRDADFSRHHVIDYIVMEHYPSPYHRDTSHRQRHNRVELSNLS